MQEKRNEIDSLRADGVKVDPQRFLTLLFDKLLLSHCDDFRSEVKLERNAWVKDPVACDTNKVIASFVNLYTNYKSTKEWDKQALDKDATIIALATGVKELRAEVKNLRSAKKTVPPPTSAPAKEKVKFAEPGSGKGPPAWRLTKSGATAKCPSTGDTFDWCPHHGQANKPKTGMYMPAGHDHEEWLAAREAQNQKWSKSKAKKNKTTPKRITTKAQSKRIKLAAHSFVQTLSSQLWSQRSRCLMAKSMS